MNLSPRPRKKMEILYKTFMGGQKYKRCGTRGFFYNFKKRYFEQLPNYTCMKLFIRKALFLLFAVGTITPAVAQDEMDQLMNESLDDGRKLISAYVSPF